jgi:hypothetical protein
MATDAQVTNLRLRNPSLPTSVTDDVAKMYLDDAALEFESFGIGITDPAYDKLLSLYALHLMTVIGLIKDVVSESVKDVSASYAQNNLNGADSFYYREFKRSLRRRKSPFYILHNS